MLTQEDTLLLRRALRDEAGAVLHDQDAALSRLEAEVREQRRVLGDLAREVRRLAGLLGDDGR